MNKKLILLFFLLSSAISFAAAPTRVEPMFWWTGMKNPDLQLLVYAPKIADCKVSLKYDGVELKQVIQVENPNYLFINLTITPSTKAGKFPIIFTKNQKEVYRYEYELKERVKNPSLHKGLNGSDFMYLIMPDRFANGDPTNDNVQSMKEKLNRNNPGGRHGGDLKGIADKFDYFKELGITALWLNPVLENNMSDYSYHGYAITDFYNVDARFGTNEEYINLIKAGHKKGLKMVMDMVLNHCGSEHWWMNDLPSSDWLNYTKEYKQTNFQAITIPDPYHSNEDVSRMVKGWFVKTMPDMNQCNPLMAIYLIQNSIWWIEYAELDAFRIDTQPYPEKEFASVWAKALLNEYPDFFIVGEAWLGQPAFVSYFQHGTRNADNYDSNFPSVFDFPLSNVIKEGLVEEASWDRGIIKVYYNLAQDFLYGNPNKLVIFVDNHDTPRFFTSVKEDSRNYKLGLAMIATTRGIPMIYYGTEILMTSQYQLGDGDKRKDFPGGWQEDKTNAFSKTGRTALQNDAFDYLQKLLNWRLSKEVIHTGKLMHFIPQDNVYVYFRYNDKETVMVVINNNTNEKAIDVKRFAEMLFNFKTGKDVISTKTIDISKDFKVDGKTAMIIELNK